MSKPYLILVRGVLAARHLTKQGALKHIDELKAKGVPAVLAYDIEEQKQ